MNDDYLSRQMEICEDLRAELRTATANKKFLSLTELLEQLETKRVNKTLVTSSGTFLLPHFGHSDYLDKASSYGDVHVVCLNTDESIRRLGRSPDFVPLHGRVIFVATHGKVDYVTLFDEDTPELILSYLRPNVYAKGEDWAMKLLPERETVESNGGRIVFIPHTYDFSASKLVTNIMEKSK